MKNLDVLLTGKNVGHLYPFFWQKGEKIEMTREYVQKMYEQGIRNFCVESRPHPNFLEDGWWQTMDAILGEAEKRDMHLWILDDDKFPTGHANGKVPDSLKRRYIQFHCFDIESDNSEFELNMTCPAGMRKMMQDKRHEKDKIIAVIAVKKNIDKMNCVIEGTEVDITDSLKDGFLTYRLPEGHWSIFAIYETLCSNGRGVEDYLDPMCSKATKILLSEVYEKHYTHYADCFGKTILGFFSDEPSFGNDNGRQEVIGKSNMPLPWNNNVQRLLEKNEFKKTDLIWLFRGNDAYASACRYTYMNIVTSLYQQNFTDIIGDWCRNHGVLYLGHVIEDDNAHARLGAGPGHYFRAMDGQDMAGIDIIGGQVVPGMDYHHDAFSTDGSDGEFYLYGLVRMGASDAKLDSKKHGRLMCEAFGAYGWCEGLKMMKWITDHMISHGVNWIVPHAFDPAEFPDWDCPPHFYAHGMNPQYPYFHIWEKYADRLCTLFSDGVKDAEVGILYHANAEWYGKTMLFQKPCRVLQQNQIDSDIISEDYLMQAEICGKSFVINKCEYKVLVIPGCERLPKDLVNCINRIAKNVLVYAVETVPENVNAICVSLENLPGLLKTMTNVSANTKEPHLVAYHYIQNDGNAWMFTNESIQNPIDTEITLNTTDHLQIYDAMNNRTFYLQAAYGCKTIFHLYLNPYESLVLVSGEGIDRKPIAGEKIAEITHGLSIGMQSYQDKNEIMCKTSAVGNLAESYKRFSGTLRYRFKMMLENPNVLLHIDEVYETVHVIVNGKDCGTIISPEYVFDLSNAAVAGENNMEIEVINTLCRALRDPFSMFVPLEPLGIISSIEIYEKKLQK